MRPRLEFICSPSGDGEPVIHANYPREAVDVVAGSRGPVVAASAN